MARIRTLRPEFFSDTYIADLPISVRYFYTGLWCHMDRQGITEDDPKLLKRDIFPYDDKVKISDVADYIQALVDKKRLLRFTHEHKSYLFCPTFAKHQRVHHKETVKYEIPSEILATLGKHGVSTVLAPGQHGVSSVDSGYMDTGYMDTGSMNHAGTIVPDDLMNAWNQNRGILPEVIELSKKRKENIKARLKDEPDLNVWVYVIRKIAATPFCIGSNSSNWRANFDWLLRPDTRVKVLEGNYDKGLRKQKVELVPADSVDDQNGF